MAEKLGFTDTQKRLKGLLVGSTKKRGRVAVGAAKKHRLAIPDKKDGLKASATEEPLVDAPIVKKTASAVPPAPTPSARVLAKKQASIGSDREDLKEQPCYSDVAQLRLINLIYDPLATMLFREAGIGSDEAHLLSLTRINSSREAMCWAQQITKEAAFNVYINNHVCSWPLGQVRRIAFLLARRSIPGACGPGFMLGVGLAQEQNITKQEEAAEESDW